MGLFSGLIGGALSLIGGRRDRRQRQQDTQTNIEQQDPVYRVKRLEAAGLNPDTHFGATGGNVIPSYAPVMGQAIADAGALIAGGIDNGEQLRLQKTRLELEKAALEKALKREVIRPTVGGVYQQRRENSVQQHRTSGYRVDNSNTVDGVPSVLDDANGPSGSPHAQPDHGRPRPQREVINAYIDVYDSDTGRWHTIPNPELTESGPLEAATGLIMSGAADLLQNTLGRGGKNRGASVDMPGYTTGNPHITRPKSRPLRAKTGEKLSRGSKKEWAQELSRLRRLSKP